MKRLKRFSNTILIRLGAEINAYKRIAGEAIFEIGRRLKHVKENDLVHGEFGKWLRSIDFDESQARRFMKVAEELGDGKATTWMDLPFRALYEIATLPPEEREHTLESGETKKPEDMTVRELREVKKTLREREQTLKIAES